MDAYHLMRRIQKSRDRDLECGKRGGKRTPDCVRYGYTEACRILLAEKDGAIVVFVYGSRMWGERDSVFRFRLEKRLWLDARMENFLANVELHFSGTPSSAQHILPAILLTSGAQKSALLWGV